MLPAPRVTIGIPAYNNAETIVRTIRSVQAQTVGDWRILISDDASDDDTAEIALREATLDRRISVIRQPKRLGYMNFDHVLKRAETPYFAWLAADDRWERHFLEATLAVLEAEHGAVSALPACRFEGSGDAPPDTSTLSGSWAEKARAFMAAPNGTRMYGLFRREALALSFPARPMHGYDWLLVLRVLRHGDQIGMPETLLVRARTDWRHYAKSAAEQRGFYRAAPVLDMTLHGLLRGQIPFGCLRALWRLNLQKHAEQTFLEAPDIFLKRAGLYRRLGVEAATTIYAFDDIARRFLAGGRPGAATDAWLEAIRCEEPRPATYYRNAAQALLGTGHRDEAERLLQTAAERGEASADLVLGEALSEGWLGKRNRRASRSHFRVAERGGEAEGRKGRIVADAFAGRIEPMHLASHYADVAKDGSASAAAEAGRLITRGVSDGVDRVLLREQLEEAKRDGLPMAIRPLAVLIEEEDPIRAASLYLEATTSNGTAWRDLVRTSGATGDADIDNRIEAVAAGLAVDVEPLLDRLMEQSPARRSEALFWSIYSHAISRNTRLRERLERFWEGFGWEEVALLGHRLAEGKAADPHAARHRLAALGHAPVSAPFTPASLSRLVVGAAR